ncbi:hypothetical protein [Saccharothrix sp. ALI-22-I]|uniref:hypothetical protein n=1 Tax=Saccharothrix sp. ALI-22-I TaxID=1933778 RepID=UPI001179C6BC|nr:hypothetical protein [Saccharothrix sp. ALI-22-I]
MSGDTVTGGQFEPLRVAGVAGGAGVGTFVRLLTMAFPRSPIVDANRYAGGRIDVLVTNNTVASAMNVGPALNEALRFHKPILVVMDTQRGVVKNANVHLNLARTHAFAVFEVRHRREWVGMAAAPGKAMPKGRDLAILWTELPKAIKSMRDQRTYMALFQPRSALPPIIPSHAAGPRNIPPHAPVAGGLRRTSLSRAGPGGIGLWPPPTAGRP